MTLRQAKLVTVRAVIALGVSALGAEDSGSRLRAEEKVVTAVASVRQAQSGGVTTDGRTDSVFVVAANSAKRSMRSDRIALVNGAIRGMIQTLDSSGNIRNLSDITVSFYRKGALSAQALPGADGVFTARLAPGFYTLVAYGPSGYCTYGLEAVNAGLPNEPPVENQPLVQIESLAVPPVDFRTTYSLSQKYARRSTVGPVPTFADESASPLEAESPVASEPQTSIFRHIVRLDADGGVPGRLNLSHVTMRGGSPGPMMAFLVRGGAITKQTTVAADGAFKFSNVTPGTYSFITAGPGGFSAFSVVIASPERFQAGTQTLSMPR